MRIVKKDRISELPYFIIHQIMSYLPAKQVAQISVLSKRWNYLRKSFPILDFNQANFIGQDGNYGLFEINRRSKTFRERMMKFIRFVDVSLLQFCQLEFRVHKFRLIIRNLDVRWSSFLDKWIELVVGKGVKEIDFNLLTYRDPAYTLPQTIFSAESMTTLKLSGCKLEQPVNTMRFYSLKKLTLERVCINEEMVQKLTSECPLLEDLAFSGCKGLKRLCVFGAPKLRIMRVDFRYYDLNLESVEIAVSSLQQLTLMFPHMGIPQVIDIAECLHLEKLKLVGVNFTDKEFNYYISKLHFLEDLCVSYCCFLEEIKISSNRLKHLEFCSFCNLKRMDIDTPNLLSFSYTSNKIPTYYSINIPCPWKVFFELGDDVDTRWYLNMKKFLGVSNQIEDLSIWTKSNKISFDLDEFKESSYSLPCLVGNLNLAMCASFSNYRDLLNDLLWICYPKTLSIHTWNEDTTKFGQWIYEELRNTGDIQCCTSCHIKCWRHHFKDFKMGFLKGSRFSPDKMLLNINDLTDIWPNLQGGILQFHIDWCFSNA